MRFTPTHITRKYCIYPYVQYFLLCAIIDFPYFYAFILNRNQLILAITMPYNPKIHHRSSIRLQGYDYAQEAAYFITICIADIPCLFGYVENDEMILGPLGQIAGDEWLQTP